VLLVADQFSTEHTGTTSTGTILGGALTFTPSRWSVQNLGTVPVRFSLNSTSPATGDAEVRPGTVRNFNVPSSKFGVLTTSTSTDGLDVRAVRVSAWGA
jgi:hypothetical protein